MKKMLIVMALVVAVTVGAYAQTPYKIQTYPKLPARDALERMQLVIAWNMRIKVLGNRDGLYSVQIIPGEPHAQVVVQTYEGAVYLFDAEHGDLIWKTKVGVPYWAPQPAGYNSQNIYVTRRSVLHVLDRNNGTQRVFTVNTRTNDTQYGYDLQYTPSAAPVAEDELRPIPAIDDKLYTMLYISMGDRISAVAIPEFAGLERARIARESLVPTPVKEPVKNERLEKGTYKADKDGYSNPMIPLPPGSLDSPTPKFIWGYRLANEATNFPPLVHGNEIAILSSHGSLIVLNRIVTTELALNKELFQFKTSGNVTAAAGQHGAIAYVGSDDYNLYAVNMKTGVLTWRHISGAPIRLNPKVNDVNVFIAPERLGLRCLDRKNGREIWTNPNTSRFLAANRNFVYALDRHGKFFVLDTKRGTTLASHDLSDWAIPVFNELTDRIYLAANDGQILCLRQRDNVKPLTMKTLDATKKQEKKPIEVKKKPAEDKIEEEKKIEDEKKEDKEKAGARFEPRSPPSRVVQVMARAKAYDKVCELDERRRWAGR